MLRSLHICLWLTLLGLAFLWHPFKTKYPYTIYNLSQFQKDTINHQYLLLKNNYNDTIYNDEYVKGPFQSVMQAYQQDASNQKQALFRHIHFIPIVRKHYGN